MPKKPFFSIVIPTYNRMKDLQFALYCIFQQSFTDFEIIISDNCSTDDTSEVIAKLKDRRIRYFKNKKNIGVIPNVKQGIKYVKGVYIFLHSDDDFLLYNDSLQEIYNKITKYKLGYIRVSYLSLTPDKKHVFDFRASKVFARNQYLSPSSENKQVLSFILDTDATFVTGLVFRNYQKRHVGIIKSEFIPWIEILFCVTKNFGAYYIAKPHIIASWSEWRIEENGYHLLYGLIDGKLTIENYLKAVQKKLNSREYQPFLHNILMGMYVLKFPAIKLYTGNKNMLQLSARIRSLNPSIGHNKTFWIYLILAFLVPRICLKVIRIIYFYKYVKFSKIDNHEQVNSTLSILNEKYARDNIFKNL